MDILNFFNNELSEQTALNNELLCRIRMLSHFLKLMMNGPPRLSISIRWQCIAMLAHCNLKQNMRLCSKQSSSFPLCTALWWQIKRRGGPLHKRHKNA